MINVDEWLAEAAKVTYEASSGANLAGIQHRIALEPAQLVIVARHEVWRTLCCAAVAALVAFTFIEGVAINLLEKPVPMWVATPPAASPFGLLIGK
ncbi:CnrY/NccY family anti-sigma factor [Cupriavidus metallidurans]|jgi:nickel and cobalt resistance protein CnrY|uniref:CnrY/NccY family anti-sigma factor n=1 Tax=Cupriavidus metallidurans TaxID=119219 RepID=UPI0016495A62|nr:CnrY/NccY family anti-sigma factor [Cupriavidus metallidurans]